MNFEEYLTPLYHIEPAKSNSLLTESITSYLSRLAKEHCLLTGDLLGLFLAPRMGKRYLEISAQYGGSRFYESSASMLGNGQEAADWVRELNECTGHNDLHRLTMIAWRKQIPSRNLIKPYRSWCPQCLDEMSPHEIYEPLIWAIMPVRVCPIHKIPLETICPKCSTSNYHINRRHCNGFCNRCGAWLGGLYRKQNNTEIPFSQQWCDNFTFLFNYSSAHQPDEADLKLHLGELMNIISNGQLGTFSRILNKPKSTVWGWIRGNARPTLLQQLTMCDLLSVSLEQLYYGPIKYSGETLLPGTKLIPPQRGCAFNYRNDYDRIKVLLEDTVKHATGEFSLRSIAEILGINIRVLRKHFPDLCHEISRQYLDRITVQKENRIENELDRVQCIADQLIKDGRHPSRRAIEGVEGKPLLLNKEVRKRWEVQRRNNKNK